MTNHLKAAIGTLQLKHVGLVLVVALVSSQVAAAKPIDFASLLDEMVDRDALARLPAHTFLLKQASSYDRASVSPDQPGWYANGDGAGHVRTESNSGRTERVLLDVQGPGAIVRFWATYLTWTFTDGTVRFYFDDSDSPQIEGPVTRVIHGDHLVDGVLAQTTGGFLENEHILAGRNLYLPLPYANGCKITYDGPDEPFYFAINYREYADTTEVKTFSMDDLDRNKDKISEVQRKLVDNSDATSNATLRTAETTTIGPGKSASLACFRGPAAIREIALRLEAGDHRQALRSTVIEIKFDGEPTVWAPIGDFFGTGYRLSPYESRYHRVTLDGEMLCRWVMPFQDEAEITVHNHGDEAVSIVGFKTRHDDWRWDDESLYFHTGWRSYPEAPTAYGRDTNYITLHGRGHYVGDSLAIFNAASGQEPQPWWGEGDEKIYVDGEAFPSHFGTGTEDYYGFAWVGAAPFHTPFLSQPLAQGNRGRGLSVLNRSRILDVIPFQESIKVDMEIWSWVDGIDLDYTPTTFWYGALKTRPAGELSAETSASLPNDLSGVKRRVRTVRPIEAEGMAIQPAESGVSVVHTYPNDTRLGNRSYWMVRGMKPGHAATGSFFAEKESLCRLNMVLVRSENGTLVDLLLNDDLLACEVDLQASAIEPFTHTVDRVLLQKGRNDLTIRASHAPQRDEGTHEIGVDRILLTPVE